MEVSAIGAVVGGTGATVGTGTGAVVGTGTGAIVATVMGAVVGKGTGSTSAATGARVTGSIRGGKVAGIGAGVGAIPHSKKSNASSTHPLQTAVPQLLAPLSVAPIRILLARHCAQIR